MTINFKKGFTLPQSVFKRITKRDFKTLGDSHEYGYNTGLGIDWESENICITLDKAYTLKQIENQATKYVYAYKSMLENKVILLLIPKTTFYRNGIKIEYRWTRLDANFNIIHDNKNKTLPCGINYFYTKGDAKEAMKKLKNGHITKSFLLICNKTLEHKTYNEKVYCNDIFNGIERIRKCDNYSNKYKSLNGKEKSLTCYYGLMGSYSLVQNTDKSGYITSKPQLQNRLTLYKQQKLQKELKTNNKYLIQIDLLINKNKLEYAQELEKMKNIEYFNNSWSLPARLSKIITLNKDLQSFKQRLSTDNQLTIEIVENNLKDFKHDLLQLQNNEA